jgi:hypothetical protein
VVVVDWEWEAVEEATPSSHRDLEIDKSTSLTLDPTHPALCVYADTDRRCVAYAGPSMNGPCLPVVAMTIDY